MTSSGFLMVCQAQSTWTSCMHLASLWGHFQEIKKEASGFLCPVYGSLAPLCHVLLVQSELEDWLRFREDGMGLHKSVNIGRYDALEAFFFFFFFFFAAPQYMEFPSQGSDPSYSCDLPAARILYPGWGLNVRPCTQRH